MKNINGICGLVALLLSSPLALAANFDVTSTSCSGAGSFQKAVEDANASPGPDTITFLIDVTDVKDTVCGIATNDPEDAYIGLVTDDLVIEGKGHSITGSSLYVTPDGLTNVPGVCPGDPNVKAIISSNPVGLLRMDANINVTVNDLTMTSLRSIALLRGDNANLTLNRVTATRTFDFFKFCDTGAIYASAGANQNVTITDSVFSEAWNDGLVASGRADGSQVWGNAFINAFSDAGTLSISGTRFDAFAGIPAIQWDGEVKIASTRFTESGLLNLRGGTATVTNSLLMGNRFGQDLHDRIMTSGNSSLTLEASTVAVSTLDCFGTCLSITGPGAIIATENATIELKASAVSVGFPGSATVLIREATGGNVTATAAPNPNWVQPVADQDADVLRTLLNQPALLTDAPGLPNVLGAAFFYQAVTPLVDDGGGTPGLLIDTVTDADTTNVLISPVDSSTITEDIFGNPRTEAAGTVRDIGAVQLSLASTVAVSNPDTSGATVVWTQPKDPDPAFPITGYGVIVEPTDGSTAPVRIDVSGPDTLTVTLTGLAPNTEYRVTVVAVSANGDGPPSNMPSFTTRPSPVIPPKAVPAMPPWAMLFLVIAMLAMGKRGRESKYKKRLGHKV